MAADGCVNITCPWPYVDHLIAPEAGNGNCDNMLDHYVEANMLTALERPIHDKCDCLIASGEWSCEVEFNITYENATWGGYCDKTCGYGTCPPVFGAVPCTISSAEHLGVFYLMWCGNLICIAGAVGYFAIHRALLLNWFGDWTPVQQTVQAWKFYLSILWAVGLSLYCCDL